MNLETLELRNQSWIYMSDIKKIKKCSVRVTITRNAYDFQSSIVSQVFNPKNMQWNFLDSVPFTAQLRCFRVSYVGKASPLDFRGDAEMMMERAKAILG